MKRLLSIIILMLAVVSVGIAQNLTASNTSVYAAKGAVADTINKNASITYSAYVPNFCYATRVHVTQTQVKGYAKTKTYIETSFDFVTWTKLDSVSIAGTAKGITVLKNPYTQYLRLRTVALDSTQTTRVKYHWLIEKRP